MFTQLLTTTAALLLLGAGPVSGDNIRSAGLYFTDVGNATHPGTSWGTLIVRVKDNYNRTVIGMVCDDSVDDNTADFLCRAAGYPHGMQSWTNNRKSLDRRMASSQWFYRYNGTFALDNLRCPAGARRLDDCSMNSVGRHDCYYNEGLVLKCRTEARGVDLDSYDVQMQKGS